LGERGIRDEEKAGFGIVEGDDPRLVGVPVTDPVGLAEDWSSVNRVREAGLGMEEGEL